MDVVFERLGIGGHIEAEIRRPGFLLDTFGHVAIAIVIISSLSKTALKGLVIDDGAIDGAGELNVVEVEPARLPDTLKIEFDLLAFLDGVRAHVGVLVITQHKVFLSANLSN